MPIYTRKNQYQGVNAHLHSHFQAQGGWSSFHTNFIAALARDLNAHLPDGFIVDIEQSLQIREIHPDSGDRIRRPEPDLTIYRTRQGAELTGRSNTAVTLTQAIIDTFDLTEDLYYTALVIYRALPDAILGNPVTRIELLSPTNKQGDGAIQYREKRYAALKSEVALVEIDFLHETPPVVKGVPPYPTHADSHAYNITVSDPSPSFDEGTAQTSAFSVDTPIPAINIPLGWNSSINVDFDRVYNDVYTSLSAYSRRVDYEALPLHFDHYSTTDQARIYQHMDMIRQAVHSGIDLEA